MIEPTIGRNLHYITNPAAVIADEDMVHHSGGTPPYQQPFLAFITYVWSTTCVNLLVVDHEGNTHCRACVPINTGTPSFPRAEWMDYQKGQAARTEAVEEKLAQKLEQAITGQIDAVVCNRGRTQPSDHSDLLDGHDTTSERGKMQSSAPSPEDGRR